MIRVTIILRTTKTEGTVKLRFRLREGQGADLYHKSEIRADIRDLNKFDEYGNLKPKVSLFNKELKIAIIHEMDAMNLAYASLCERMHKGNINGEMFEAAISAILNPETQGLKKAKRHYWSVSINLSKMAFGMISLGREECAITM